MNDINLITVQDIKELTSISQNVQPELLEPFISIGQSFFVDPILGESLVSELKNQLTGNTLSNYNNILLANYIRPLNAYAAWYQYIPFNAIKSTLKGEVKQSSDNSTNADLNELVFKRSSLKEIITFYENRLKDYLEVNKLLYPNYRPTCATNNNYSSGIYLGKSN